MSNLRGRLKRLEELELHQQPTALPWWWNLDRTHEDHLSRLGGIDWSEMWTPSVQDYPCPFETAIQAEINSGKQGGIQHEGA